MENRSTELQPCKICGSQKPTVFTSFSQTTGAILVRYEDHIYANMCTYCLRYNFRQYTKHNLLFGWWAPISAFFTIVYTIENTVAFFKAKRALSLLEQRNGYNPLFENKSIDP